MQQAAQGSMFRKDGRWMLKIVGPDWMITDFVEEWERTGRQLSASYGDNLLPHRFDNKRDAEIGASLLRSALHGDVDALLLLLKDWR